MRIDRKMKMKKKKEMNWRARLYNDISSRRETERRNEMLLKAAFNELKLYNIII